MREVSQKQEGGSFSLERVILFFLLLSLFRSLDVFTEEEKKKLMHLNVEKAD